MSVRPKAPPAAVPPKRRRRSAQAQDDFRRQIVDTARRIFREQGYEALSIRAVTEPLGVSQMAFYAYFPSKGDLLQHIWSDMLQEQFAGLLAASAGCTSPEAVLRAHLRAYIDYWVARPDQYRHVMSDASGLASLEGTAVSDLPAYRQIVQLHRDRVLACAGATRSRGAGLDAGAIDRLSELAYVKVIGYLHATLGIGRYPFSAPEALQDWVIDDIVAGILQAGATRRGGG